MNIYDSEYICKKISVKYSKRFNMEFFLVINK